MHLTKGGAVPAASPRINSRLTRVRSIGIVIPAHNEAALIDTSLDALERAARHPGLRAVDTRVLVVLDRCTDRTEAIVRDRGVAFLVGDYGNVGAARAAGFSHLNAWALAAGLASCWFSSTDADTEVDPCWLVEQVRLADRGADAVFGVVDVDDWSAHPEWIRDRFQVAYRGTAADDPPGHPHVHGASMGLRADAYHHIGGFAPLPVGEDQALSDRLDTEVHLSVVRSTSVRVTTSARTEARAPRGFSSFLVNLGDESALAPAS